MLIKDFDAILNEIPILMSPYLKGVDKGILQTTEGMAVRRDEKDRNILRYTVLNYTCDNMAKTLLHKSIHHYNTYADKWYTEQVGNLLWNKPEFRRSCQNKIVELCGRYSL